MIAGVRYGVAGGAHIVCRHAVRTVLPSQWRLWALAWCGQGLTAEVLEGRLRVCRECTRIQALDAAGGVEVVAGPSEPCWRVMARVVHSGHGWEPVDGGTAVCGGWRPT